VAEVTAMPMAADLSAGDYGNNRCPSGKRGYTTRADAQKVARQARARGQDSDLYYRCDHCGRWHTTKEQTRDPGRPEQMGGGRSRR